MKQRSFTSGPRQPDLVFRAPFHISPSVHGHLCMYHRRSPVKGDCLSARARLLAMSFVSHIYTPLKIIDYKKHILASDLAKSFPCFLIG